MNLLYQSLHVVGSLAKDIRAKERVLEIARVDLILLISSLALMYVFNFFFGIYLGSGSRAVAAFSAALRTYF